MRKVCVGVVLLFVLVAAQTASAQEWPPCEQVCYPGSGCSIPCDLCLGNGGWVLGSMGWECYGGGRFSVSCYDVNYPDCEPPPTPPDPGCQYQTPAWGQDYDNDRFDDGEEESLARTFMPSIMMPYPEACLDPVPVPILYRARHPAINGSRNNNVALINYVMLYSRDCGPWNPHDGDAEVFMVVLTRDGGGWVKQGVYAVGHWDTGCEKITHGLADTPVWVSYQKHANYASLDECWDNWACDYCWNPEHPQSFVDLKLSNGGYELFNVGEQVGPPTAARINNLCAVRSGWYGNYVWDRNQGFLGGPANIASHLDACVFFPASGRVTSQDFALCTWVATGRPDINVDSCIWHNYGCHW